MTAPRAAIQTQRISPKLTRALWLAALAAGVALRLYIAALPPIVTPDSTGRYERLARSIVAGRGLATLEPGPLAQTRFNQPGYPVFLAAVYAAAGESRRAVVLAQFVIEALIVAMILILARRARLQPLAEAAVACAALLCPVLPTIARAIWSETLATAALVAALCAWRAAAERNSLAPWILAGAASGLCLLIRPDLAPALALMALAVFIIAGRALSPRRAAAAALVLAATLAPWVARNYFERGKVQPLGVYMNLMRHPYVRWLDTWVDDASQLAPYAWQARSAELPISYPPDKVIDPVERARAEAGLAEWRRTGSLNAHSVPPVVFDELAEKARRERPFRTFVLVPARRLASTWVNVAGYAQNPALRILWIAVLMAAAAGAWWGLKNRFELSLLLLATVLGRSVLPLISALGVEPRLMVEALPAIFIFLGFLCEAALEWKTSPAAASEKTG